MASYGLTTTVPPTDYPLSVEEAKLHLRIDHDEEYEAVADLISAATQATEKYCSQRWIQQTLRLTLNEWPCDGVIRIPVGPVQSISSIQYVDLQGTLQTLATSGYQQWLEASPAIIAPASGQSWPSLQTGTLAPIRIVFVAGYGAKVNVPGDAKVSMKLCLTHWYENRGDGKDPHAGVRSGIPPAAIRFLDSLDIGAY